VSVTETEWMQVNLRLPRDLGDRLILLLEKIADATGTLTPLKVKGCWQDVADSMELLVKLAEGVTASDVSTWSRI
jgi:hypothetical protein